MAPVDDHIDVIEAPLEERLIRVALQRIGHHAGGVGEHSIPRDDRETQDTAVREGRRLQ
jgi:hypothetical protein